MKKINVTLPNPGSEAWRKQFIKALRTPSFNYTPSPELEKKLPLPTPPEAIYGRVTKQSEIEYEIEVRWVKKENAFRKEVLNILREHAPC